MAEELEINYELIDADTYIIRVNNPTGKINAEILEDLHVRGSDNIKNIQVFNLAIGDKNKKIYFGMITVYMY